VESLLSDGVPVDSRTPDGQTPLHIASHYAYTDIMSLLLKAKSEPSARTATLATPLHLAAKSGSSGAIELLLDYTNDAGSVDAQGRTPAEYAQMGSPAFKLLEAAEHAAGGRRFSREYLGLLEGMPDGWDLCWSKEHERYYYQNNKTRVTQWEDPRTGINNLTLVTLSLTLTCVAL